MMKIFNLLKKNIDYLKDYPSITINIENNSFVVDSKDTSRVYLISHILNKENIIKINKDRYSFKPSDITNILIDSQNHNIYLTQNTKPGHNGNISLSYESYNRNERLLNNDMFDIINKSKISILLEKNNIKYIIDILNLDDWYNFMTKIIYNGYVPFRIVIQNITGYESSIFYNKIINSSLNKIYDKLLIEWVNRNGLVKMSGKEINDIFNKKMGDYIETKSDLSNNRYYVKISENKLIKIYIISKYYLFYPYGGKYPNYNNKSFVKMYFNNKYNSDLFDIIDIIDLYSNKYKNFDNIYDFFIKENNDLIHECFYNLEKTSNGVILSNDDIYYKNKLNNKLHDNNNHVFEMSRDYIRILEYNKSKIIVNLYDRSIDFNNPSKRDNYDNKITWFNSVNELRFEREKILSAIYIEEQIESLKNNGHININIDLERQVKKKDGRTGYIDCIIKSEKDGNTYAQSYEFKAIPNFNNKILEKCEYQAENYNIIRIMDDMNVNKSYDNFDYTKVKLINLIDYYKK